MFSDSHRDTDSMKSVVSKEKPNMIIHLGDNLTDAQNIKELFPDTKIAYVRGNTDFNEDYISENHLMIEERLFFITHGHRYNVKWSKKEIKQKGIDDNADVVLFGHTHEPYVKCYKGIWFLNPGSIGRRFIRKTSGTYGVIDINSDKLVCNIVSAYD